MYDKKLTKTQFHTQFLAKSKSKECHTSLIIRKMKRKKKGANLQIKVKDDAPTTEISSARI